MKRCYQVLGFILTGGLVNISMAVSSPFDGFYVGGKMGVAVSDTREVDQIIDRKRIPASGATNGYHFNDNTGDQSPAVWAGSLFGGYGHALGQRFYVSVDGEWLLRNPRLNGSLDYRATVPFGPPFTQEYHEIANYDLSINGGYALSFNPGILLTPTTLLYFSFGYTGAKAHLIMEHTVRDFNVPTVNVDTEDQYLRGLRVGLGMQFYFRPHWSAGVEYLYTNYTSHNLYGEQYFLGTLLTRSVASYFSAHADMVSYLANVTYHFNGDNLPAIKMQVGDFEGFYVGLNLATLKGSLLDDTLRNTYLDQVGAFDQTDRIDSNVANYRIQPG
ncbi:MAG: outer membrane beta-barrel protein, partial [Coxiellaceae bacterium]|nr:outer membrane beta-barrel protein [Coxiellaceae bacterium]